VKKRIVVIISAFSFLTGVAFTSVFQSFSRRFPATPLRERVHVSTNANLWAQDTNRVHMESPQHREAIAPPVTNKNSSKAKYPPSEVVDSNPELILSPQDERRLAVLTSQALKISIISDKISNSDGSIDEKGTTDDGFRVTRHFDPQGRLRSEMLNTDSSDELITREFYQAGGMKFLFWKRSEKDSTTIQIDESGLNLSRYDDVNDMKYLTVFDDLGRIAERKRKFRNGESETIWQRSE